MNAKSKNWLIIALTSLVFVPLIAEDKPTLEHVTPNDRHALLFTENLNVYFPENNALKISKTSQSASEVFTMDSGPTFLTLKCGIKINLTTGQVEIPATLKLDEASRKFWIALAESFPGVKEAWLRGYETAKR